jgi:hypothetical protein
VQWHRQSVRNTEHTAVHVLCELQTWWMLLFSIQARIAVAGGSQSQGTDKGFVRFRSLEVHQDSCHYVQHCVPVERLAGIRYSGRLLSPNDWQMEVYELLFIKGRSLESEQKPCIPVTQRDELPNIWDVDSLHTILLSNVAYCMLSDWLSPVCVGFVNGIRW